VVFLATDRDGVSPASAGRSGSGCRRRGRYERRGGPFLRINRYEDALRFDRHRAVLNAGGCSPCGRGRFNGEINVVEFLDGSGTVFE